MQVKCKEKEQGTANAIDSGDEGVTTAVNEVGKTNSTEQEITKEDVEIFLKFNLVRQRNHKSRLGSAADRYISTNFLYLK
jgi:hypothetical protein